MLVMNDDDGKTFRVSVAAETSPIIPERLKHGRITVNLHASPILFYSKDKEPCYANKLVSVVYHVT